MDKQAILSKLLNETAKQAVSFLKEVLPDLYDDWWKQAVLNSLSFQQRRLIEQRKIESLSLLDLAALLRVLDQNWYQISSKLGFTIEQRHYVKEMQTIRNRWAHTGTDPLSDDDLYRDVDTLQRFALVIKANESVLSEIKATKSALLAAAAPITQNQKEETAPPSELLEASSSEFAPGRIVCLRSNPSSKGAVVAVMPSSPECRVNVFINGGIQTYYASQLIAEESEAMTGAFVTGAQFQAHMTALQIRHPGLSTLYSLNAARVDFIPYQFRPILKFIRSDRPRLLIADGVGVGKTIEAGLILRELQARREVKSVLIICPRPLVTERKWESEMKRFDENFVPLKGETLRYCIDEMDKDGTWPDRYQKVILPYSLFDETLLFGSRPGEGRKKRKGLLTLDPPPRFDLVIVDEAHHIRNTDTFSHRAVRFFCDHAEAVVFLTATPIQLGSKDLFVLLNTLRPDLVLDLESFAHMSEPNPFINEAVARARGQQSGWETDVASALDKAVSTPWGQAILKHNPDLNRVRERLASGSIPQDERIKLITDIESLHTFSGVINRTRRRDIGNFTIRKPETVTVDFTPPQKEVHDEILRVQEEIFKCLHNSLVVKFMMTTIRRQAASCLFGLAPFLKDILNRHMDELSWDEADDTVEMPLDASVAPIEEQIKALLDKASKLDLYDPKLEALRTIIRDKQKRPTNKVMLFSSFRHTLSYLEKHLRADGVRVGVMHGGTPDEERRELRARFMRAREQDDTVDVMLFSEIGCEGLDYQFCDCMVNYDLPWNPMRVEQRIGRIDRNGQKSESVAIFNMITPGTVDADIYERCLLRIGVFNTALGTSEEILGEITTSIRAIAENYTISEEERKAKFQQLADNEIRLLQEQDALEQRQFELFGIRLPENQMKQEIQDATSFWLSPDALRGLVLLYLQDLCGKGQDYILGEKSLKTLRLSQDARSLVLRDFTKLPRQNSSMFRDWENWLKDSNVHRSVAFESECASQNPDAMFIMPLHPLVKQAAMALSNSKRITTALTVHTNEVPAGKYEFVIYQWQFCGIKEDLALRPVTSSEVLTSKINTLLEKAETSGESDLSECKTSTWDVLDARHYAMWSAARAEHQRKVKEIAEYRRESLSTSHRARTALLGEQLNSAENEKIRRMRQSQIDSAEADYARHIQELDIAMERADIIAQSVAYGILTVR